MPFGIGGSKSRSSQNSSSSSFDNLDASSFSVGGSGSSSSSGSASGSQDSIAFQELFAQLFGGASAAAGGVNTSGLSGAANQLFGAGSGFLDSLGSGGAGGAFLEEQLAGSDAIANEQIDLLGGDIEKFLNESILPSINQKGVSAGTFGGSRGEVASGVAGEGAIREFQRGASGIRANERARTDSIATSLLQNNTEAAGAGIGGLSDVFGLAESGAFAGLSPFAALAQILGDPTVLSESSSISQALSEAFGFDISGSESTGRAGSESESSGTSKGKSFNLGF